MQNYKKFDILTLRKQIVGKVVTNMNREKLEEIITTSRLSDLLSKKEDEKAKSNLLWILAIIGTVAAVAGIAYAVYRFFTPDYFEDDFEDDFDEDFFDESDEV